MQKNKLQQILIDMGLSENESAVYFTSLSLGSTTILKISKSSGIKRTTVYSVIDSLIHRGLMNIEIKGFKKIYAAENPDKLVNMLDEKKMRLNTLLPEFSALFNLKGEESIIKHYIGLNGVKTAHESLLKDIKAKEEYLVISDSQKWLGLDKEFFDKFIKLRSKLPIKTKLLLQNTGIAKKYQTYQKNFNLDIKLLPENTMLSATLAITPQKILITQLTPPIMAIVIENNSMIQLHREMFYIIWNTISDDRS